MTVGVAEAIVGARSGKDSTGITGGATARAVSDSLDFYDGGSVALASVTLCACIIVTALHDWFLISVMSLIVDRVDRDEWLRRNGKGQGGGQIWGILLRQKRPRLS